MTPGVCSRCGECCRWILVSAFGIAVKDQEHQRARGCRYLYIDPDGKQRAEATYQGTGNLRGLLVPSTCPNLKYLVPPHGKTGVWTCTCYDDRPRLCSGYDGTGDRYYRPERCTL